MARRRRKKLPEGLFSAEIESLTHEGKGVAHIEGKAVFIQGALPSEQVKFEYIERKRSYDEGVAIEIIKASPERVEPECEHYSVCGGCSMQHLAAPAQIANKQAILIENLKRIGKVSPEELLPPITSNPWGYRRRARLGVKYVAKKEKVLVGFREKRSPFIAEISTCKVLEPRIGEKLTHLSELIASLSLYNRIPQIEVAIGDEKVGLVFRHLDPLPDSDAEKLIAFGQLHQFNIYGQAKGPDTIKLLWGPDENELSYALPDLKLSLAFRPSDFTQVNMEINRKMINQALALLDLSNEDEVLDLFCGLGNFTLPMARQAKSVVGVEGSDDLVNQGRYNAQRNELSNVAFHAVNLTQPLADMAWAQTRYDKILVDPPRSGAFEVMGLIAGMGASRIVYVSCNPATLARDAHELVNEYGYCLTKAGVMDMFPHTAHVESIAVFEAK